MNLVVGRGEICGFIGHNGAGKTTAIRAVAGVLDFEEGVIEIDGVSIKKAPVACKANIAYIPDNPDLYDHLTGMQYLNFIGDLFSVSKADRELLIKNYSDAFQITANLGDMISSYSHGMKQKLAIISALIHTPKLLVLDEPFVGLVSFFTTINKASGVLFSYKDYDLVMSLPVKTSHVVASRILQLYVLNLFFTLMAMLPAGAVYAIKVNPGALFYLFF